MINQGSLEIRFHENARLLLTPIAKAILYEGKKVQLAIIIRTKNKARKNSVSKQPEEVLFNRAMEEKLPGTEDDL